MRRLSTIIQALIIIVCTGVFIYIVDWNAAMHAFLAVSFGSFCLVLLQRCTPYIFLTLRLAKIFSPHVSPKEAFQANMLCHGTNVILPARPGEIVKILWLKSCSPWSFPRLISGCFVERLLDVTMLVALTIFFAAAYMHASMVIILSCAISLAWLALFLLPFYAPFVKKHWGHIILSEKIRTYLMQIYEELTHNISPKNFIILSVYTFLIWCLKYLHVFLLTNYLLHLSMTWYQVGGLCAIIFFSGALFLAPAGIGITEVSIMALVPLMGIGADAAAATAIFTRVFSTLPPLLISCGIILCNGERVKYILEKIGNKPYAFKQYLLSKKNTVANP